MRLGPQPLTAWARAYYSLGMKTYLLLAAMLLAPLGASAQVPVNENARAALVQEIEAARTALLPQTAPLPQVTVRYTPRLNDLKGSAVAAKDPAQLEKAKKDFADWKTVVLRHLYGEAPRFAAGAESFDKFSAAKASEINFTMALRQQLSAQRVQEQVRAVQSASRNPATSWGFVFDSSPTAPDSIAALSRSAGAGFADAPLPANDPKRYDKIRSLLLSQGVSPKIIDTAIAEGRRQKVDPMIVLSVINQESNFRRNAYNKGSGCTGLMQLDPATAADMGVHGNLYDPAANI